MPEPINVTKLLEKLAAPAPDQAPNAPIELHQAAARDVAEECLVLLLAELVASEPSNA